MELQHKLKKQKNPKLDSLLNFTSVKNQLKELDEQNDSLEKNKKKDEEQIFKLVQLWKQQKKVNGVQDSEVEQRVQTLFMQLDSAHQIKKTYLSDIQTFQRELERTKATTTKKIVKLKALEDIIIQRDSKKLS